MTYPTQAAPPAAAAPPPAAGPAPTPAAWDDSAVAVRAPRPDGLATAAGGAEAAAATAAASVSAQVQAVAVAGTALAPAPEPPHGPPVHNGQGAGYDTPPPRGRMRRVRIGSHLASPAALARLGPAAPASGLVVGIDHQRRPVAVRLFRSEPTRVAIVGGVWAVQLLVFRAFAVGARVVVVSDNPQSWVSFGQHATGRTDRLLAVAPESLASGATARAPVLVVDDRGEVASAYSGPLGPWQTQVTVLRRLDRAGAALVQGCDLAVLQRLGADEASIATHALRLPARSVGAMQDIPDDVLAVVAEGTDLYVNVTQTELEQAHVGRPSPRPVPPPSVPVAAPPPAAPAVSMVVTPVRPAPPQQPLPPPPPPPAPPPLVAAPQPAAPPRPSPAHQPPAPLAPGPALATAPVVPAPEAPGVAIVRPGMTAPAVVAEEAPEEEAPRRRRRPVMVGVGAIAVLTLAGWIAGFLFTGTTPRATPTDRPAPPSSVAAPQEVVRPLPVPAITATLEDDGIRFSWTYEEPAAGDFYRVQRTDVENPQPENLTEPTFVVANDDACLQVQIFRADGQGGPAQVKCFP